MMKMCLTRKKLLEHASAGAGACSLLPERCAAFYARNCMASHGHRGGLQM